MRDRLLSHLYSALDKAPDATCALRLGHPAGLAWMVAERRLTLATEAGTPIGEFDLQRLTLADLADQAAALGCEVKYQNPDIGHLQADVLLDGYGRESQTNGDNLNAYTSLLWSLIDAFALETETLYREVPEAHAQLYLSSADEDYLDFWGDYLGVARMEAETDDQYRVRIIFELLRAKSNPVAMAEAATAVAGQPVEIYEPWKDLLYLSVGKLDQERTYNGADWSPYVYRPILRSYDNVAWERVKSVLERLRPAGVLPLDPEWVPPPRMLDGSDHSVAGFGVQSSTYLSAKYEDRALFDYTAFDTPPVLNYRIVASALHTLYNRRGMFNPADAGQGWTGGWDGRSWGDPLDKFAYKLNTKRSFVRAQVVLSEAWPLGNEQARFPRSTRVALNRQILGEARLSDFDPGWQVTAVEVVDWRCDVKGLATGIVFAPSGTSRSELYSLSVSVSQDWHSGPWRGGWSTRSWRFSEADPTGMQAAVGGETIYSLAASRDRGQWQGDWDSRTWASAAAGQEAGMLMVTTYTA